MTETHRPARKTPMRQALAEAAFELFLERGFEQTTVDDIVARAGVGRRSFFRYFPSKEDVVFPDHEGCLAEMTALLEGAGGRDPVAAVCEAARLVMLMYAANPEFSVRRYRMTREVPGLRSYELSVVRRYERVLAGHLRERYAGAPDGDLRAEVVAAAVVAAHNNGLRTWLRSGGEGDVESLVDHALGLVRQAWGDGSGSPAGRRPEDDVVVLVARKGTPVWRVVQSVESALAEGGQPSASAEG